MNKRGRRWYRPTYYIWNSQGEGIGYSFRGILPLPPYLLKCLRIMKELREKARQE